MNEWIFSLAVELHSWLGRHLNQTVLLSAEIHWTLVLHAALILEAPIDQLKLARYVCCKL